MKKVTGVVRCAIIQLSMMHLRDARDAMRNWKEECDKNCGDCDLVLEAEETMTAYDMAIAALEKQEPVKPEHHTCDAGDYYSCPKCGNRGVNDYVGDYCNYCGQLLSWKGSTA